VAALGRLDPGTSEAGLIEEVAIPAAPILDRVPTVQLLPGGAVVRVPVVDGDKLLWVAGGVKQELHSLSGEYPLAGSQFALVAAGVAAEDVSPPPRTEGTTAVKAFNVSSHRLSRARVSLERTQPAVF
jgi:hypothetical protein